jgi:hypothetical protein
VLGLFTDEPKGALVEVEAIPVPEESRNTMFDVVMLVHREDAHKLLRALASGDDLHFALMNPAPPEEEPFLSDPLQCLAKTSFDRVLSKSCPVVSISDCGRQGVVVWLVMA